MLCLSFNCFQHLFSTFQSIGPLLVCSLFRYRLNIFLPQLLKVGCPIFLEIWNPWGKWKEVVSDLNICVWKWSKIGAKRKLVFWLFCLTKHVGNHTSQWIRDLWSKGISLILAYLQRFLSFCVLNDIFRFSKKSGFLLFLVHLETTLPDGLETSGRRAYRYIWHISRHFEFLRFGGFFLFFKKFWFWCILGPTKHGGNHASQWIRDLWSKGVSLILAYF